MMEVRTRRWAAAIAAAVAGLLVAPTGPAVATQEPPVTTPCDSEGEAGTAFVRGINCRTVEVDGYPREYIVYVPHSPSFALDKKTAVVFHFHGTGGNAGGMLTGSQWTDKAEQASFALVFGSGLEYFECAAAFECSSGEVTTKWNSFSLQCEKVIDCDYPKPKGYPEGAPWPADDVAFTDAMLSDVRAGLVVDPRRIYLSGFSNGGAMALRLSVERSHVFAATGTAGPGILELAGGHDPIRKMPLYYAIGNRDGNLLGGINSAPDAPDPPINALPLKYDEAFAFSDVRSRVGDVVSTFGVSHIPTQLWEFHDELRISYRYPEVGNLDGNEVLFSFQGGVTHQWPNANENPEGFHDPDIFWKFFHDNPLPK